MSKLQLRGSIALATVVAALLLSKAADAQVTNDPGPPRETGGLLNNMLTGVQLDLMIQAKAEHRLQHLQAKIGRDAERGHSNAVARDARRIDKTKYCLVVEEWLIRKNSLQDPGCYPYPLRMDAVSCAAIANAARPPYAPPIRLAPSHGW